MSHNQRGGGVIDLRPLFGITKAEIHLPEELGDLNFERFYKHLREEDRLKLNVIIFAWSSKINNFGHAAGLELAGKLGCWLRLHDPHNTCLNTYRKRRKENLI